MGPSPDQVAAIEAWLREKFPGAGIESGHNFDREVELFRARNAKAPAPASELEISDAAFEDHPIGDILVALERQDPGARWGNHPGRRLFLDRELALGLSTHDPRR